MSPKRKHHDVSICDLSSDSQNVHPANSNTDFIIDFPTQLLLDWEWEMALLEINRKNVYLFCDWCMESIMHGYLLPVLRKSDAEIQHILYMPIHRGTKNRIILYIKDKSHKTPSFDNKPTTWKLGFAAKKLVCIAAALLCYVSAVDGDCHDGYFVIYLTDSDLYG